MKALWGCSMGVGKEVFEYMGEMLHMKQVLEQYLAHRYIQINRFRNKFRELKKDKKNKKKRERENTLM